MILYLYGATIADLALILTFVISIFFAYRKGFTYLVFNFICLLITIFAVLILCKPLTAFVYDNTNIDESFSKGIQSSIGNFLEKQLDKSEHINTSKTNIARPIAEKINGYLDEAKENAVDNVAEYIAEKLSYIVISALVVIFLFIAIRIATIFLRTILFFITELPFIHSIDKVGGIFYGVIRAYTIVYLVLAILSLISPLISNTGIIAVINNSKICERFYNNNVFLNIFVK